MPLHPAWAKNISRRVLWAALEDDITKVDRSAMAQFFGSCCAYCGDALGGRWHADHLLSVDQGGFNHVSNRVPSCAHCNEKEKRERQWEEFLRYKCGTDQHLFENRKQKIIDWRTARAYTTEPVLNPAREAWRSEVRSLAACRTFCATNIWVEG
jgi:hypothetical protein